MYVHLHVFVILNLYKTNMFSSEEWDLWVNIHNDGGEVYKIKKTYFLYRKHAGSTINNYSDRKSEMIILMYVKIRKYTLLCSKIQSNYCVNMKSTKKATISYAGSPFENKFLKR